MQRTLYRGVVRDSQAEAARDARMLALHEQGVSSAVIAQRMGVTIASVRARVKRARAERASACAVRAERPSGQSSDDAL